MVVARGSTPQALSGLLTGLLFSTVVLGAVHAQARFTFGQAQLCQGVNFIPAMVGLFGVSEVLRRLLQGSTEAARQRQSTPLHFPACSTEAIAGKGSGRTPLARFHIIKASATIQI